MRILIGTPAGGGVVTTQWLLSYAHACAKAKDTTFSQVLVQHLDAAFRFAKQDTGKNLANLETFIKGTMDTPKVPFNPQYDMGIVTLSNESLLGRGRNHLAQLCLMQGWDKLLFIDADCGFTWEDVKALVDSPSPIVGGACPLKVYVPDEFGNTIAPLNYKALDEDVKYHTPGQPASIRAMDEMRKAYGGGPEIPVKYLGTAFLCIHRSVLLKLTETADHYGYPNSGTGFNETHWDFFKCEAIAGQYMSEDWGFCHMAREAGYQIMLNTNIVVNHTGSHTFLAQRLPPEAYIPRPQLAPVTQLDQKPEAQ